MPLQRSLGGGLEQAVDLLDGRGPLDLEDAVGQRSVEQRHPDGDAVEPAVQLRIDQPDGRRRAGVVGISDRQAARARRRSLWGASTIVCVFVMSWMVVMTPWRMPMPSWITLTTGARQLVVQEAAVSR